MSNHLPNNNLFSSTSPVEAPRYAFAKATESSGGEASEPMQLQGVEAPKPALSATPAADSLPSRRSIVERLITSLPPATQKVLQEAFVHEQILSALSPTALHASLDSSPTKALTDRICLPDRLLSFHQNVEVSFSNFYKGMFLADCALRRVESNFEQALSLAREAAKLDVAAGAHCIGQLALILAKEGVSEPVIQLAREALQLNQEEGIPIFRNLALRLTHEARLKEALELVEEIKAFSVLHLAEILKELAIASVKFDVEHALILAQKCYEVDAYFGQEALNSLLTFIPSGN